MAYLLSTDGRDDDVAGAFRRYRVYLDSVRDKFPVSAFTLAASDWYFNFHDHRCPHDAWLESTLLTEPSSGERSEVRTISLKLRLLGAFHDGFLELRYPRVWGYRLNMDHGESGHGIWRYDELRLSENGNLVHEIEWCGFRSAGTWVIEASDVVFSWLPNNGEG